MKKATKHESDLKKYLEHHDQCWKAHNDFDNSLLNNWEGLEKLTKTPFGISIFSRLHDISIFNDRSKRILANILKNVLDREVNNMNFPKEDLYDIITLSRHPFYVQYSEDLAILDTREMASKYFRGCERLAELRIKQDSPKIASKNIDFFFEEKSRSKTKRKNDLSRKYGPIIKIIDEILHRDHIQEYLYRYSLVGIADYYLHELASKFTNTFIESFDERREKFSKITESSNNSFKYVIPRFIQTPFRCAATAILNGVSALRPLIPNHTLEKKITNGALALPNETTATLPTVLAKIISGEFSIGSTLYFENNKLLHNDNGAAEEGYFNRYVRRLKDTFPSNEENKINVKYEPITHKTVRDHLVKGPFVTANWIGITHYRLIYGFNNEKKEFYIFDPQGTNLTLPYKDFDEFSKTPFGKWGIGLNIDNDTYLTILNESEEIKKDLIGKISYLEGL